MGKILVVDDDNSLRAMVCRMLETNGHQVREASDGNQACKLIAQEKFDLVFCDIFMPSKDGLETIQAIGSQPQPTPVVAMSGGAHRIEIDLLPYARTLGAVAVLTKPFDYAKVLEMVRVHLPGSNNQGQPVDPGGATEPHSSDPHENEGVNPG